MMSSLTFLGAEVPQPSQQALKTGAQGVECLSVGSWQCSCVDLGSLKLRHWLTGLG